MVHSNTPFNVVRFIWLIGAHIIAYLQQGHHVDTFGILTFPIRHEYFQIQKGHLGIGCIAYVPQTQLSSCRPLQHCSSLPHQYINQSGIQLKMINNNKSLTTTITNTVMTIMNK